jgi:hypothetical protein
MNVITLASSVCLALLAISANAAPVAQGSVNMHAVAWKVADGVVVMEKDELQISFSDHAFDRNAMAEDGKLDSWDVFKQSGPTLTLHVDKDGPTNCIDFSTGQGGGSSCNSDYQPAIKITTRTQTRIAGNMQYSSKDGDNIKLNFDLPINSKIERAGEKLPAGGGDPGKAVLSYFAAMASGDAAKIKAVMAPAQVAQMNATMPAEMKEMLGMMKMMAPTGVKILGGVVNGDKAIVDFSAKDSGGKISGTANLIRVAGKWNVESTSTQNVQ